MPNVSAFGDTPEAALDELYETWEGINECYRADGEEIPISRDVILVIKKNWEKSPFSDY